MTPRRQFVTVNTSGPDQEGCLLFDHNGALVGVLVRLSTQHERGFAGKWFLEHGFGALDNPEHPIFETIEEAEQWIGPLVRRTRA